MVIIPPPLRSGTATRFAPPGLAQRGVGAYAGGVHVGRSGKASLHGGISVKQLSRVPAGQRQGGAWQAEGPLTGRAVRA